MSQRTYLSLLVVPAAAWFFGTVSILDAQTNPTTTAKQPMLQGGVAAYAIGDASVYAYTHQWHAWEKMRSLVPKANRLPQELLTPILPRLQAAEQALQSLNQASKAHYEAVVQAGIARYRGPGNKALDDAATRAGIVAQHAYDLFINKWRDAHMQVGVAFADLQRRNLGQQYPYATTHDGCEEIIDQQYANYWNRKLTLEKLRQINAPNPSTEAELATLAANRDKAIAMERARPLCAQLPNNQQAQTDQFNTQTSVPNERSPVQEAPQAPSSQVPRKPPQQLPPTIPADFVTHSCECEGQACLRSSHHNRQHSETGQAFRLNLNVTNAPRIVRIVDFNYFYLVKDHALFSAAAFYNDPKAFTVAGHIGQYTGKAAIPGLVIGEWYIYDSSLAQPGLAYGGSQAYIPPGAMSGRIRSNPNWRGRPVVFFACNAGIFSQQVANELGVTAFAPSGKLHAEGATFTIKNDDGTIGKFIPHYPQGRIKK